MKFGIYVHPSTEELESIAETTGNELGYSKLKKARIEAGLTQQEFAEMTGLKQANVAKYENGNREPLASTLKKMADALGKTMDEIF